MSDDYKRRSYGDTPVGFGKKPGIVVVDFMKARIGRGRFDADPVGLFQNLARVFHLDRNA